jgi:transaldolase
MNKLERLSQMTTVVADTGELAAIRQYKPVDATTNPSLVLKTLQHPDYRWLLDATLTDTPAGQRTPTAVAGRLAVRIGREILAIIPGRVSTEVDARLSFDMPATLGQARRLVSLYSDAGIDRERILIKIAATWEGIQAARILESEGISTNLTLVFNLSQAIAAAQAHAFLISPFVGRILDWHKSKGMVPTSADEDPGVQSVRSIYHWYKTHGVATVVMGASFRNTGEIEALAGCDRLTISPALLASLRADDGELQQALTTAGGAPLPMPAPLDEKTFRWQMNEDPMATEKLAEGIRLFKADQETLESMIKGLL